jgi:hypothetical protein
MELQRVCLVMIVVNLAVAILHPIWALWLGERIRVRCTKEEEEEEKVEERPEEVDSHDEEGDSHDEVDSQHRDNVTPPPLQEGMEMQAVGADAAAALPLSTAVVVESSQV